MIQCDNCGAFVQPEDIERVRLYLPALDKTVTREWCWRCKARKDGGWLQ